VLARWDGNQQKVVLEPQPAETQAAEPARGGTKDEPRSAVEVERKAQRGTGNGGRTAAE